MKNMYANDLYPTVWGNIRTGGRDYVISTVLRGPRSETLIFRSGKAVNGMGVANVDPLAALTYHECVAALAEVNKGRLKMREVDGVACRVLEKDIRTIGRNLGLSKDEVGSLELALR